MFETPWVFTFGDFGVDWKGGKIAISKNLEFYLERECRKKPDGLCNNQCFDALNNVLVKMLTVPFSRRVSRLRCNQNPQRVSP